MAPLKRLTEEQRREIGELANDNPNISQLGRKYGVSRGTIYKWLQEGREEEPKYTDKQRIGRPRSTDQRLKAAVRRLARRRLTCRQVQSRIAQRHGLRLSQTTVCRVLKGGRQPMQYSRIKRGRELKEKNRLSRLEFCKGHLKHCKNNWVFIDAKDIYCYFEASGRAAFAWQRLDEHPSPQLCNPWVFRVYAAVALGHKSDLVFAPPSPPAGTKLHKSKVPFNSSEYIKVMARLKESFVKWYPRGRYHIIQDRAKQHTSNASVAALTALSLPIIKDYPAQSWDLNIIENVWGILEGKLLGTVSRNTSEWRAAIEEAWQQVQQDSIDKLVKGMNERLQSIIHAEGKWVKHH